MLSDLGLSILLRNRSSWFEGAHVLAETTAYRDLSPDYFTRRIDSPDARKRRLIHELEAFGHKVTIEPNAA
jgi:hypothetical protein